MSPADKGAPAPSTLRFGDWVECLETTQNGLIRARRYAVTNVSLDGKRLSVRASHDSDTFTLVEATLFSKVVQDHLERDDWIVCTDPPWWAALTKDRRYQVSDAISSRNDVGIAQNDEGKFHFYCRSFFRKIPMTDAPAPIPEEMVEKSAQAIYEADPPEERRLTWAECCTELPRYAKVVRTDARVSLTAAGVPALLAELAVIDSVLAVGAVADIPDRADKIQALMNAAAIAEDRLYRAQARVEELEAAKNGAYAERDKVVAALAKLLPSGTAPAPDCDGEAEPWHIVYVDTPAGQCSWHYPASEEHLFSDLPPYQGEWDGHNTEEKYARLADLHAKTPKTGWSLTDALTAPLDSPENKKAIAEIDVLRAAGSKKDAS